MPKLATSDVSYAKHKLPYPIYAADFDPYRRGYLVVGGGGGESSTGIANTITVLDVSDRRTIAPVAQLDLSSTEDSVSSLANLGTRDGLIALAGINSSTADQRAGKNEHFRAFDIRYPPRKKQKTESPTASGTKAQETEKKNSTTPVEDGQITLLGKRAFFKPAPAAAKEQTYQRLLRLSPARRNDTSTSSSSNGPPTSNKRIGAMATGLAPEAQIIVFNATVAPPEEADILARIDLPSRAGGEAVDLDITQTTEGDFSVAWCDDYNLYEQTFEYDFGSKTTTKRPQGPRRVHQMPAPETMGELKKGARAKFRCLRFLNDITLLALVNRPGKRGAELRLYHLYPTGPAMEVSSRGLPSHIKQAACMDVCILDADAFGTRQVVVAVAGQDVSVVVLTTNFSSATETFSPLASYLSVKEVHEQGITQLCFEPFHPPHSRNADSSAEEKSPIADEKPASTPPAGPQYIRLASTSYANTVVVETFPLSPLDPKDRSSRYVLSHPADESFWFWAYALIIAVTVVVTGVLLQGVVKGELEQPGGGVLQYAPEGVREWLGVQGHGARRGFVESVTRAAGSASSVVSSVASAASSGVVVEGSSLLHHSVSVDVGAAPTGVEESLPESTASSSTPDLRATLLQVHAAAAASAAAEDNEDQDSAAPPPVIVIRDTTPPTDDPHDADSPVVEAGIAIATHPDKEAYLAQDVHAKHWHELDARTKSYWKQKLIAAGQWAEHEGEAVLKGVLWSTYAGFAGQVAGEILREL